ncbi:DUF4142 domain-containing protein [Mucilaginibacter sp.]|uniref:DUF4142 domain-containing protein n=1 Tax=Mucilaginibacter sp. TaxID=1882438 RepID=UPI0026232A6A|nr:DUF4142 domain-containing protein [Mucilaginibacter sp.]MDB5030596.1 hypothetical protein [Mucilaginibacter sp.]
MKKLITLLMLLGNITAFAQSQTGANPDSATLIFVTQANLSNMKEVHTGQLAISKAKTAGVKAFGTRMVADHTKADNELMQIIKSKRWQVSPPAAADVAPDDMLTRSLGYNFDRNYVRMMVQDHKKAVAYFETAAVNVPDPEVKAFIRKTLPVLRQHLASIQTIATNMGITYK